MFRGMDVSMSDGEVKISDTVVAPAVQGVEKLLAMLACPDSWRAAVTAVWSAPKVLHQHGWLCGTWDCSECVGSTGLARWRL
jgi:hypothetical protein